MGTLTRIRQAKRAFNESNESSKQERKGREEKGERKNWAFLCFYIAEKKRFTW